MHFIVALIKHTAYNSVWEIHNLQLLFTSLVKVTKKRYLTKELSSDKSNKSWFY